MSDEETNFVSQTHQIELDVKEKQIYLHDFLTLYI